MLASIIVTALGALASPALSLTLRDAAAAPAPRSAMCPYNYPVDLNTTDAAGGLIFTVVSQNPATNNRAVQLRSVAGSSGAPAVQVAAVDASSPVLLGQLRNGSLLSANRSVENQLYYLGPSASLVLASEPPHTPGNSSRYALTFANETAPDTQFLLQAPNQSGEYGLYHHEADLVVNGFIACQQQAQGGAWYQLYYYTYTGNPPNLPGCDFVGVRTTAAAYIFNGACDIGGYTA